MNIGEAIDKARASLQDGLYLTLVVHKIRRDIKNGTLASTDDVIERIEAAYERIGMIMDIVDSMDIEEQEKRIHPAREGLI